MINSISSSDAGDAGLLTRSRRKQLLVFWENDLATSVELKYIYPLDLIILFLDIHSEENITKQMAHTRMLLTQFFW